MLQIEITTGQKSGEGHQEDGGNEDALKCSKCGPEKSIHPAEKSDIQHVFDKESQKIDNQQYSDKENQKTQDV